MPSKKSSKPKDGLGKRLTGQELLTKLKGLGSLSKLDKAKACGYLDQFEDGTERIQLHAFLNALIDAQGIDLDGHSARKGVHGRKPKYRVKVQRNGSILVGSSYTEKLGWEKGTQVEVKLGRRHIRLEPVDGTDWDEFEQSDADEEFDSDEID